MSVGEPPCHVLDSRLFRDLYGTAEMRAVFSDLATLKGWYAAEAALARAQGELGVIPEEAARVISAAARSAEFDLDGLRAGVARTGHPFVPALAILERLAGEAGSYVHWGATTQDIMDTGAVLQMREALGLVEAMLQRLIAALADQARVHKLTPMAGRTHGQHAVPITFGLKLAVLAAEFHRHRARLAGLRPRLLVGQLAGAAGTLATLGSHAKAVREAMMADLGLGVPAAPWHTARDGIAECVACLAMIGATCGKLANEIVNLQRTEVAEVAEPAGDGAVGSSTMPQKRNPMLAQTVVAIARLMRQLPAQALDAMAHEHERDMAAWQMEWAFVPEAFVLASGALVQSARIIEGLEVDTGRMRANLQASGGLINAEAVMMRLAEHVGHARAKALVTAAAKKTKAGGELSAALLDVPEIAQHLASGEVDDLLQPEAWVGEAADVVEDVWAALQSR